MSINLVGGNQSYSEEAVNLSEEAKRLIGWGVNTSLEAKNYLESEDTWTESYGRSAVEDSFEYLENNDEEVSKHLNLDTGVAEYFLEK